jgi:serine/threonine-protein kinase
MSSISPKSNPDESNQVVGSVVAGRYRLTRLIGEGGMGAVYEAEHVEIGKRVAIKLVHSIHARHAEIAARFRREARSASAIESDHIVQVFDAGNDPELGLFMVMELLRGEDLGTLLARTGRLDQETACSVVLQAASALEKAHAASIVHRDLKPANIFLVQREDYTAMVKLVDFGIAKIVRDETAAGGSGLTRMGSAIGTPNYMSPEQAQGLHTLDHRTDIYSLGAVLYEMVVGEPPYPEMPTYEQTILQILMRPVPRASALVPRLSPALDQLIDDMMKADPAQRVGRMREVRERILAHSPGLEQARLLLLPANPLAAAGSELRVSGRPASGVLETSTVTQLRTGILVPTRAQTNVGVTYDTRVTPAARELPPPAPKPRRSAVALLAAVVGFGAIVAVAALLRSNAKRIASGSSVGLVTSVMPVSLPLPPVQPPPAEPEPRIEVAQPASSAETPAVAPAPKPAPVTAAAARHVARPAPAAPKEKAPKPGGQVGGVGISSEF